MTPTKALSMKNNECIIRINNTLSKYWLVQILVFCTVLFSCQSKQQNYSPSFSTQPPVLETEYIFGVHPLYNPKALNEIYGPLADVLTEQIPHTKFRLEASRNYASFDQKLYNEQFHFALPNPYQTLNAIKRGYHVIAKQGDDYKFCGIIIVKKDTDIQSYTDLKGKKICFPAPTALAATMMPQYLLHKNGVKLSDVEIKYVGSQESSILNVYNGLSDAGATWPVPWHALIKKRPEIAEKLEIKWQSEPLVNNSIMAHNNIPDSVINQVKTILINLHKTSDGKKILERMEISKLEEANNETYRVADNFLIDFNENVRPIKID